MTAHNILAEVFDRGLRSGMEALTMTERELFRIQDFIIEYEMGGLSGYFYNRLPDLNGVRAAVTAMQRHKLSELAALVGEATELFAGYVESDPPTTWEEVCRQYDPASRLEELDRCIGALDNYGIEAM